MARDAVSSVSAARPAFERLYTSEGRPRRGAGAGPNGARSVARTKSQSTSAASGRRIPAAVMPRRAASSETVAGPSTCKDRAIRSAASPGNFTTSLFRYSATSRNSRKLPLRTLARVSALAVEDLHIAYGEVQAVRGVSLSAASGAVTALVGPNGAGKTSILEACTGIRDYSAGTIRVLGSDPGRMSSRVGTMLQAGGLYPTARPLEWLEYLARVYPDSRDPRELLDLVGLDARSRTTARRMSGGEQQRLKLAAALLPGPELLFLDEPTAGMDPQARRRLIDVIKSLRSDGVAVMLTTHLLSDIEELADHVIVLRAGIVERSGSLAELLGEGESMTFEARSGLDLESLGRALAPGYRVTEPSAGRYVIEGEATPRALALITGWLADHDVTTTGIRTGRTSLEQLIIGDES